MLISQKHTCMQEYTTALQTNTVCFPLISPLSPTVQVAAYLLDFLSLPHAIFTATLSLVCLSFIPGDEFLSWTIYTLCHSINTHSP